MPDYELKCTIFLTGKEDNLRLREVTKHAWGHRVTAKAGVLNPDSSDFHAANSPPFTSSRDLGKVEA